MPPEMEQITTALVRNGHRLTQARRTIVETFIQSGGHITADDLADRLKSSDARIGRMTVYRTLELLMELGFARPIFQGTGAAHFILMDEGSHHHLLCSRCHAVIEFDECSADSLLEELAREHGFVVHSHLLEIHGLCRACHASGSPA